MTSNIFEEMDYREGFAGGCYRNGTAICVAKPEEYCDEETFVPAHFLRSNSGHPLRYCAGDLADVVIGRCVSSGGIKGQCSNLQSRCTNTRTKDAEEEDQTNITSSFIEYDPTCTITQDLQQTQNNNNNTDNNGSSTATSLSYVTYGKCGDRCVWSPTDCIDEEIYIPNDNNCTADKVQIGACFAGHAFCAVDPSSCTQPNRPIEPFWTHQEVKVKIGANCFLSSVPVPVPVPVQSPTTSTTTVGTVGSNIDENATATATIMTIAPNSAFGDEENLTSGNNTNNRLNTGALVTIVTVVAIVVGVAIGIIGTVRFSNKRKKDDNNTWTVDERNKQHPTTLPIEDIEIMSSTNHNNNNNNPMDNVDANSDLSEENDIVK